MPPGSTIPLRSRVWPAALAGAWPITTPTGNFGSGDRICYHGVMDMFRNPKLSAAVYASQKTPRSPSDIVLEVSSGMALGDLPGGVPTACWVFTNAESVRLYRGNDYIAEFTPDRHGRFAAMTHPPI